MVGPSHRQQLQTFIKSMHDQGILDQYFQYLIEEQSPKNRCFVSDTIVTFINDADVATAAITRLLNDEEVNFDLLSSNVHQLQGSSGGVGGSRVTQLCRELRHACNEGNKERCLEMFEMVKSEYQTLRGALSHIQQVEDVIHSYETRNRYL